MMLHQYRSHRNACRRRYRRRAREATGTHPNSHTCQTTETASDLYTPFSHRRNADRSTNAASLALYHAENVCVWMSKTTSLVVRVSTTKTNTSRRRICAIESVGTRRRSTPESRASSPPPRRTSMASAKSVRRSWRTGVSRRIAAKKRRTRVCVFVASMLAQSLAERVRFAMSRSKPRVTAGNLPVSRRVLSRAESFHDSSRRFCSHYNVYATILDDLAANESTTLPTSTRQSMEALYVVSGDGSS